MKLMLAALTLLICLKTQAAEIKLATATSDTVTDVTVFYIETNDDGSALAMRYITTSESGQIIEDVHSRVEEIQEEGLVVKVMERREIVRLFLEKFDADNGADVRLRFLSNGVTGSTGSFMLKLTKKDGVYVLTDTKGDVINSLFLGGNWSRLLRRWIGVSAIKASHQLSNK